MNRFDQQRRCPGCMKLKPDEIVCPFCGFSEETEQTEPFLPLNVLIENRYAVGRVLESNGEGVTYLGYDTVQESVVRIREYLPKNLCVRETDGQVRITAGNELTFNQGLMAFLDLARSLARLREIPAVLPVYDIFESGGTAYYVSETVESITLREFLLRNGGSLTWEQAKPLVMPLLSGIAAMHRAGMIHRGISPETVLVGRDGKLRLAGFCIPDVRMTRSQFTPQLFAGYAAPEQYAFDGVADTYTDVYGFTATLYRILVGNTPPEAPARLSNDRLIVPASVAEKLPAYVMDAMSGGLQLQPEDRTQDMSALREELSAMPSFTQRQNLASASKTRATGPVSTEEEEDEAPQSNAGKYALLALVGTLAMVLVVGAVLVFTVFRDRIFPEAQVSSDTSSVISKPPANSEAIIKPSSDSAPLLVVPNFVKKTYSEITGNIEYTQNFKFAEPSYDLSDTVPKGQIISQTPAPNEAVEKGATVKLVISLGPKKIKIPSLKGITREEAEYRLLKAGVINGNIEFVPKWDNSVEYDKVIGSTPEEGSTINWYEAVTVYYSIAETESSDRQSDSTEFFFQPE